MVRSGLAVSSGPKLTCPVLRTGAVLLAIVDVCGSAGHRPVANE